MLPFTKGCTIELEITSDEAITDWKIKAKFYDSQSNSILLATSNDGGSDDEIEKTSSTTFVLKVPAFITNNWEDDATLEIKVDTGDTVGGEAEVLSVYKGSVKFIDSDLDWENDE